VVSQGNGGRSLVLQLKAYRFRSVHMSPGVYFSFE
jgi:hypothetical protein